MQKRYYDLLSVLKTAREIIWILPGMENFCNVDKDEEHMVFDSHIRYITSF